MSVAQYQSTVNSLDRDISQLEEKKANHDKQHADKQAKIVSIRSSIAKYTSPASVASKLRDIEHLEKEAVNLSKNSADTSKDISDKRKRRNDAYTNLQRAQSQEQTKQNQAHTQLQSRFDELVDTQKQQSLSAMRQDYVSTENINADDSSPEYDVFLSHAWEDKESFTDELVQELKALNISVWYDTDQIKWGDSLRKRIDEGLCKSKFGIVVISPDYIKDGKYWTRMELDGLFQLESAETNRIMPIWHGLSKSEVIAYSPLIASRKALNTASFTPREIAVELQRIIIDLDKEHEK